MTGADKAFEGSIPSIYQRYMVPMLFEPYARLMAERVSLCAPHRVLELAAGTGVVTRHLASILEPDVQIMATDLNQAMLDTAAVLQGSGRQVSFRHADAQSLPFGDENFDVALCQFGVMFFPDKAQAYREARRVLSKRGTYIFAVWDRLSANEFVTVAQSVLDQRFPADPPKFMERAPHGYHDVNAIRAAVSDAGFTKVSVETITEIAQAGSAMDAATGYCQGNPLRAEIEARAPGELQSVTELVASALLESFGAGSICGKISAHVITARCSA